MIIFGLFGKARAFPISISSLSREVMLGKIPSLMEIVFKTHYQTALLAQPADEEKCPLAPPSIQWRYPYMSEQDQNQKFSEFSFRVSRNFGKENERQMTTKRSGLRPAGAEASVNSTPLLRHSHSLFPWLIGPPGSRRKWLHSARWLA